ncbi:hypothetical protein HDU98_001025, partial [Podochytrium sp. JEL0797]
MSIPTSRSTDPSLHDEATKSPFKPGAISSSKTTLFSASPFSLPDPMFFIGDNFEDAAAFSSPEAPFSTTFDDALLGGLFNTELDNQFNQLMMMRPQEDFASNGTNANNATA